MTNIQKLLDIMSSLRHPDTGCPWDLEQSFASVAPYTLEEAYEVVDAIEREDWRDLEGELGDLLFQVVFHARLGEERGAFDFPSVVAAICDKLTRRHPHVFGGEADRRGGRSEGSWERIKANERAERRQASSPSALDGVAITLPALKRASKLGQRAAAVGFDWPDAEGAREKIGEELRELDAARDNGSADEIQEELGDLLLSVASLARHLGVDAEQALAAANRKFEKRFRGMETATGPGLPLAELDAEALETLWQAQKKAP